MVKIGNIQFENKPLMLAPMEDVTDKSFRYICKKYGADMVFTEFVSSDGLIRDADKCLKKLIVSDEERPVGIQIYGHLIDTMVEAAKIVEEMKPDVIDVNFGCPVRKIANRGAGAGMLNDIPKMVKMTKEIVKAVKTPVTVKTRLGWDEENRNIVEIAEQLQDTGIKALTIHGRTKVQLYKGNADWTLIGEVKKNPGIKIPVIGNGDIIDPESAKTAFEKYCVDGIMIGRGAIGKPWLFREIKHFLETGEIISDIGLEEKVKLAKEHFKKSVEVKDIPRGIYEMRRHFINYFKGLPNFKETRLKLVTSTDIDEINSLLDIILERWGDKVKQ